ncbi:MAG: hypothetical protein LKI17_07910 [Megasphaera cerevisiae]|nr:hypothetical protein [Megasphaera cerevisiae]
MQFDSSQYPYTSRREVVYARHGMVCTSQTLASQAGLDMLKQGGNAVDAALAACNQLGRIRTDQQWSWQRCICLDLDKRGSVWIKRQRLVSPATHLGGTSEPGL